jgi:AraC family transcriptional regulator
VSLTTETAYRSSTVLIHRVCCRPEASACGPIEHVATHLLVLPLRGVFVKHHGHRDRERGIHDRVVADPCHALFFNPEEPYRVSHPVDGGDECLVIEPSQQLLREFLPGESFRRTHAVLDASLIAGRRVLWHRLKRGIATALEVEEAALALLAGVSQSVPSIERSVHRRRHQEMVEATRITLASEPSRDWTLSALAKRVHSSPFRFAHIFRRLAGMPVHRYHLRARMAAALDEVLDTSRDLTTIGIDLGFSSHSHFTATFRRTFGVAPSMLRRHANTRQAIRSSNILTASEA